MWLCIKDNFLDYVMVPRLTFRGERYDDPNGDAECNVAQLLQWQLRLYKKDEPIDV